MKENEIQIVTLEKQKDTYQVSIIDHSTNQVIRIDQSTIHDQEEYCQLSISKIQSEMEVAPCSKLFVLLSLLPPLTPIKLIKQPRSKNAIMPAIK